MRNPSNTAISGSNESKNVLASSLSRRSFMAGVAALGAAGIVGGSAVAAPRPVSGVSSRSPQDQAAPSGQIILARTMSELTTLHPQLERFTSALAISYHVNEGLVKFAPTFELVPGLASEWTVSDDQLTFTFKLREGVMWHDGQPFTSKDVKFTIDTAGSDASQSPAQGTVKTYISSVETPDDKTVVIQRTQP